jgi:hypothetical protein
MYLETRPGFLWPFKYSLQNQTPGWQMYPAAADPPRTAVHKTIMHGEEGTH